MILLDVLFLLGVGCAFGAAIGYSAGRCHEAEAGEAAWREFWRKQRREKGGGS